MLREIIAAWKGDTFMKDVVEKFAVMLGEAEYVLHHAWGSFVGRMVIEEIRQPLYDSDRSINEYEREIRRMVAEHLSINPRQDVSGCLAMMSLIKDAERIGDNAKNIFELSVIIEGNAKGMIFLDRLGALEERISSNLSMLRLVYISSDEETAKKILESYPGIKEECGKVLEDVFEAKITAREAAITAVLARTFKRINSHIANIASGLVYPLDKIDFVRVRSGLLD